MADTVSLDIHGLICDNLTCNWSDMSIQVEDYSKHVNRSCPKCGECILTEADYITVRNMVRLVAASNAAINNLRVDLPKDDKQDRVNFKMDGSGRLKIDSEPNVK